MKQALIAIAALGAVAMTSPAAVADTAGTTTVQVTDYSGKPPFGRKTLTLPVTDVARLEAADVVEVRSADFSGRPPYARNVETLRVIDTARLELDDAADDTRSYGRGGRPPFKH